MAEVARLNVLIQAKADALEKELQKASRQLDQFGSRMQSIGTKLTLGVTAPILAIGAATVSAANEAEESENLFEVSMGRMADSARRFSEQVSDSLGLNSFAIRENIGQFNALFTTIGLGESQAADMAQTLTVLSADLASFFNISQSSAIDRLRSGLAGEAETLRRLNVFVNEATIQQLAYANGIAETGAELTEAQKVQARYLAILEQTALAQGDLERTQDSATNQTRRLQNQIAELRVEIGQKLQPAFLALLRVGNDIVQFISDLVDRWNRLPGPIRAAVAAFVAIAAAAGPFLLTIGTMARGLAVLTSGVGFSVAALAPMAALFAAGAPLVAGVAAGAIAIGALAFELTKTGREAKAAKDELEAFRNSIKEPITLDFVRDVNIEATLAAVKVAELRDRLEAATDPLKRLEIRTNLQEALSELARLERRADLLDQLPIVTEATITADITAAERDLTTILDRIDAIEAQEISFEPEVNPRGFVIQTAVEVRDEELQRLTEQADEAAARINNLNIQLQSLRQDGRVPVEIDPPDTTDIDAILTALQRDLRSLEIQAEIFDLSALEVAEERADLLRNALVQLADLQLAPDSQAIVTLSERLKVATQEATRLNEALALDSFRALVDSGVLQRGIGIGAGGGGEFETAESRAAKAARSAAEQAASVARAFNATFEEIGRGFVLAMARGVESVGDVLEAAFFSVLSGLVGNVFGGVGEAIGGLFSIEGPAGGAGIGGAQAGNFSSVAGASVQPMQITALVDMRGVTLFGDPAAVAATPGAQVFHREASTVARESGF